MLKFFAKKMWATHIFSAKNIRILCIESAKTVNEMTINELIKLTMLWTIEPWFLHFMQIFSTTGDNLHEISTLFFVWGVGEGGGVWGGE